MPLSRQVFSGSTVTLTVTPTLTVHANYVANDYVGQSGVAMEFTGAARDNGGSGMIISAALIDGSSAVGVAAELWLFDAAPTPPADSAAWSISDADAKKLIGVIPLSTYYASALNSVAKAEGVGIGFNCAAASKSIYGCLVTRGAPSYADGDITIRLNIWQD